MAAYFARLLIRGICTLFLSWLLVFTIMTYTPGGGSANEVHTILYGDPDHTPSPEWVRLINTEYHTDKPWPFSYLAWLFDPSDTYSIEYVYLDDMLVEVKPVPKGIDIHILGLHIQGSGVLTGDFGHSTEIAKRLPISDDALYGPGNNLLFALLVTIIVAIMLLVVIRRWGRPPPRDAHHPKPPRTFVPRYNHPYTWMFELCEVPMHGSELRTPSN
jgi:ABC-type dipeptide/oligopeptide/nickel transport system permease component